MKKIIMFVFACLAEGCSAVNATDARIAGLLVEPWMVASDDSQELFYPSGIALYGNEAVLSAMSKTGHISYGLSGIILNGSVENYTGEAAKPAMPPSTAEENYYYNYPYSRVINLPMKNYSVSCGLPINELVSAAVRIGLAPASDSIKSEQNDGNGNFYYNTDRSTKDFNLSAGVSIKNIFDLGIMAGVPTLENKSIYNIFLSDGTMSPRLYENTGYDYAFYTKVNARFMMPWLIVAFNYELVSSRLVDIKQIDTTSNGVFTDISDINLSYSDTFNGYDIGGGIASNLALNDSLSLIIGLSVKYNYTEEQAINNDLNNPPYRTYADKCLNQWNASANAAFEYRINGQFTWRAGLSQGLVSLYSGNLYDYTGYPGKTYPLTNRTTIGTIVSTGLTAEFGNLFIDGVISTNNGFLSQVAVKYRL